jgi:hypothetical protein
MEHIDDWNGFLTSIGSVEVTADMADAGVRALYAYDADEKFCSAEERVSRVFREMFRCMAEDAFGRPRRSTER